LADDRKYDVNNVTLLYRLLKEAGLLHQDWVFTDNFKEDVDKPLGQTLRGVLGFGHV
jgi:hypothetical protein